MTRHHKEYRMSADYNVLIAAAASLGFFHTILGPDHYLPFIVMRRARGWSMTKTLAITAACGFGHVASSVVLGAVGIALGVAVSELESVESERGDIAAWALILFGIAYASWGFRQAARNKPHTHIHNHQDSDAHHHTHVHASGHAHVHDTGSGKSITPWVLFTIFVLGPCEPLIPMLLYPAATGSWWGVAAVASVYGIATLITMEIVVIVAGHGVERIPFGRLERYSHALAGLAILLSGIAIAFLGL